VYDSLKKHALEHSECGHKEALISYAHRERLQR